MTATALAVRCAPNSPLKSSLCFLCSIVFAYVGTLSESRNFILFTGVAAITVVFASLWKRSKVLLMTALPLFAIVFYYSAYVLPSRLVNKLGRNIPHFENVRQGTETSIIDLWPNLSFSSLGRRGPLWESALSLFRENPLLGVSNGGFRLADECACRLGNTHNILLQSAIDAGILGLVIMCLLLAYVIHKSAQNIWSLAFVLGVISTLMVDNFTDHSYAWIIVVSFAGVMVHQKNLHTSAKKN